MCGFVGASHNGDSSKIHLRAQNFNEKASKQAVRAAGEKGSRRGESVLKKKKATTINSKQ